MTYGEQIRHPSGALDPPPEKKGRKALPWLWWVVIAVTVIYFAWRAGAFGKRPVTVFPPSLPANPHGWV